MFNVKKISFIYLTRYKGVARESIIVLRFKEKKILLIKKVKLLRVILNKELKFKIYLVSKASKVIKVVLALYRLKGL